ncbi:MAG: Eco57I restriction-modification methylase domain-containing protein, partial [Burkholderiales bacterium]
NMARQVKAQVDAQRLVTAAHALSRREHFMHWSLAFPTVWASGREEERGFDAVIGNPPWDRIKMQEVEWFAEREPAIARAARASDRKKMIDALKKQKAPLWNEYDAASEAAETASRVVRECGDYPMLSGGDVNLYSLFVERAASITAPHGIIGLLTPSGIAADKNAAEFFKSISQTGRLGALYDFENRKGFFPDVDSRFKFSALVFGGHARLFAATSCAFYLHRVDDLRDADRVLNLTAADFSSVNPNTGGAPIFRSRRDADITTRIYREFPVLVDHRSGTAKKVWPVRYATMFHMTNDSHLFMRGDEMQKDGWYPVAGNRWKKGEAEAVPLYVGRMIRQYDHRSSHVTVNDENLHNAALSEAISEGDKSKPDFFAVPQYWIDTSHIAAELKRDWALGFRDIARATDARTMISTMVPTIALGNTLPVVLWLATDELRYRLDAPLLLANFNSLVFDYVTRTKAQSTHVNWYIVEQLPMIPPAAFEAKLGKYVIADFIRGEVLRLTYTANDMQPFALDMGYEGPPFLWDDEDRRHRTARLDALFFHLYGIRREDADYILNTFPIVREQDEKAHGRFLTRDLVLAYMNAVAAGDLTSVVSV